ncbi:MAG TPA: EthD domain-containing protein [Phenylobacterium sp.]|uniref:EthD domain-containing protein n=1 Tax=Phenylobacterium sp. TaxID=1871053 RepID=UPI002B495C87|nr:EthD domain-containing protein [Phenylobacterium sp.]HKR88361.1 EthD domain-containing protein [Phenylobacterium sp.]
MLRLFFFLKRKDGITHEQFRQHFENIHVKIADKYFTNKMLKYNRYYISDVTGSPRTGLGAREFDFDCISEWTLPDEETFREISAILTGGESGQEFYRDEENFLNREATMVIKCREGDLIRHVRPS